MDPDGYSSFRIDARFRLIDSIILLYILLFVFMLFSLVHGGGVYMRRYTYLLFFFVIFLRVSLPFWPGHYLTLSCCLRATFLVLVFLYDLSKAMKRIVMSLIVATRLFVFFFCFLYFVFMKSNLKRKIRQIRDSFVDS